MARNSKFKSQRIKNARYIRTEASKENPEELAETGSLLNVATFISSREFELKQLQSAILKSKHSSSTRVFQSLPRKLRRRTASHNVKRIPKRLRQRALREMQKSDQQFTQGTRHLFEGRKHGISSRKLYKAKMMVNLIRLASKATSMKLALPQGMTPASKRLRSKIKFLKREIQSAADERRNSSIVPVNFLTRSMGSYDNTGLNSLASPPMGRYKYFKRQKYFAWLPTHVWNAKRSHMFKRWGYHMPWSPTQKNFKLTHKLTGNVASSDGTMICDSSFMGHIIIHSSDHQKLKILVKKLTKGRGALPKYLKKTPFTGLMYIEGECVGPFTMLWCNEEKVLLRIHPSLYTQVFNHLIQSLDFNEFTVQDCRFSLGSITLTGAKSLHALSHVVRSCSNSVSFEQFRNVSKLSDSTVLPQRSIFAFDAIDPRFLGNPKPLASDTLDYSPVLEIQQEFPEAEINAVLSNLMTIEGRKQAYVNQQTLKQLSKRRRDLKYGLEHKNSIPFDSSDSRIPFLLLREKRNNSWIVILPWFWILPFWYQLNRVHGVHHMGLKQFQQQSFTHKLLAFPNDYPFTQLGFDEDKLYKSDALLNIWNRKPPSKRVNYEKLQKLHKEPLPDGELGSWFSCDWKLLQILQNGVQVIGHNTKKFLDPNRTTNFTPDGSIDVEYIFDLFKLYNQEKETTQLPITLYKGEGYKVSKAEISKKKLPVVPIFCSCIERGHPKDRARIYSIPEEDLSYWMDIAKGNYKATGKRNHDIDSPVPHCYNLIGFLTSGAYHLGDGMGSGVGFISAHHCKNYKHNYILVRNSGHDGYRLAKWHEINSW